MPTITATVSHETEQGMLMTGPFMERLRAKREARMLEIKEEVQRIRTAKNPGETPVRKSIHEARRAKHIKDLEAKIRALESSFSQPAVAGAILNVAWSDMKKIEERVAQALIGDPPTAGRPRIKKREWSRWDEPIKFAFPKR